jgi:hypothetical protein
MPFLFLLENVFSFRMNKLQVFLFAAVFLLKKWDIGGRGRVKANRKDVVLGSPDGLGSVS